MGGSGGKILAVGAAGKFAGLVVPELVKRGAAERSLTSAPGRADAARKNGAGEVAVGDLRDAGSLRVALEGVGRFFCIAPVFAPDETRLGGNMVEAAMAARVRRIVCSSLIHPILTMLGNHGAKCPVEKAIVGPDPEYSILHPTRFRQNYAAAWPRVAETGVFAEPCSVEKAAHVEHCGVAEMAAIALTEDRLFSGTFEFRAGGNLDRHGVTAVMGEAMGRRSRRTRRRSARGRRWAACRRKARCGRGSGRCTAGATRTASPAARWISVRSWIAGRVGCRRTSRSSPRRTATDGLRCVVVFDGSRTFGT